MLINKLEKKVAIQACINAKGGKDGQVQEVFSRVFQFKEKNVEGHMGLFGDKLYIVYESTDSKMDWKDNFKFQQKGMYNAGKYGKRVRVHSGFRRQYHIISDTIYSMAIDLLKEYDLSKIIVTGHSLGGAISTICALDLRDKWVLDGIEVACITFGSPRVGNRHFAKVFNKNIRTKYRYQYGQDLVCGVPCAIIGYWHVDRHIRLGKWKWYNILFFPVIALTGNPLDHYPERYKEEI